MKNRFAFAFTFSMPVFTYIKLNRQRVDLSKEFRQKTLSNMEPVHYLTANKEYIEFIRYCRDREFLLPMFPSMPNTRASVKFSVTFDIAFRSQGRFKDVIHRRVRQDTVVKQRDPRDNLLLLFESPPTHHKYAVHNFVYCHLVESKSGEPALHYSRYRIPDDHGFATEHTCEFINYEIRLKAFFKMPGNYNVFASSSYDWCSELADSEDEMDTSEYEPRKTARPNVLITEFHCKRDSKSILREEYLQISERTQFDETDTLDSRFTFENIVDLSRNRVIEHQTKHAYYCYENLDGVKFTVTLVKRNTRDAFMCEIKSTECDTQEYFEHEMEKIRWYLKHMVQYLAEENDAIKLDTVLTRKNLTKFYSKFMHFCGGKPHINLKEFRALRKLDYSPLQKLPNPIGLSESIRKMHRGFIKSWYLEPKYPTVRQDPDEPCQDSDSDVDVNDLKPTML